jgi:hypothetical protein
MEDLFRMGDAISRALPLEVPQPACSSCSAVLKDSGKKARFDSRTFWTDDRVEKVRDLAARGFDDDAIAKVLKKLPKQVVRVRNFHRIRLSRDVALRIWREKVIN